jgi:hypothetical protein
VHPPVVEVVAEFRFIADSWDQTVPGLFFEVGSDDFPIKSRSRSSRRALSRPIPAEMKGVGLGIASAKPLRGKPG